jgi:hypothetical protein
LARDRGDGDSFEKKVFGQQTPRRWGWGTPLKKRAATRTKLRYIAFAGIVNMSFIGDIGGPSRRFRKKPGNEGGLRLSGTIFARFLAVMG